MRFQILMSLILIGNLPFIGSAKEVSPQEWGELASAKAEEYVLKRDWANALRFYQQAVEMVDNALYRYKAAYAATQCKPPRWKEAEPLLRQNTDIESRLLLADIYQQQKRWKAAEVQLQKVAETAPSALQLLLAWGRWADARWQSEQHPSDAETAAQYYLSYLQERPNSPWRREILQRLRLLEHGESGRLMNMAIAVLRTGEYLRAWRLLARVESLSPEWTEVAFWRGQICSIFEAYTYYDLTGKKSEDYWRQATALPEAHLALAKLYRDRGKWKDALQEASAAARQNPNWVPPLLLLGEIYKELGDEGPKALDYFQRVQHLAPNSVEAEQAARVLENETHRLQPVATHDFDWSHIRRGVLGDYGPVLEQPSLQHRLEAIVSKLYTANAISGALPRVYLLASESPNAWSLPPDGLFVTMGLVNFVDTQPSLKPLADDVLAFVLGHEWTHLLQRDFQRSQEVQALIDVFIEGKSVTWRHFRSRLGRASEVYADRYGLLLAYRSRYNPYASIAWCEAMIQEVGDVETNSEHPNLQERRLLLQNYLEGDIQRAYHQFDQGIQAFQSADLERATRAFEAYLSFFPNDGAALLNLSVLYFQRGCSKLSGSPWAPWRLVHDLHTDPELPPPLFREFRLPPPALRWWERARTTAEFLRRLQPNRSGVYQVLGDVELARREFQSAELMYNAGLKLEPEHLGLQNNLGVLYAISGDLSRARPLWLSAQKHPAASWNLNEAMR
jgi:tetratricopeptide (TPR) repeat protein